MRESSQNTISANLDRALLCPLSLHAQYSAVKLLYPPGACSAKSVSQVRTLYWHSPPPAITAPTQLSLHHAASFHASHARLQMPLQCMAGLLAIWLVPNSTMLLLTTWPSPQV